jgi:hypothetical protein
MTTFESAITRAEADLAYVQSALDTAHQVLEVADRANNVGRRLVKSMRIVAVVLAIAGILVTAVDLFDRIFAFLVQFLSLKGFHRDTDPLTDAS